MTTTRGKVVTAARGILDNFAAPILVGIPDIPCLEPDLRPDTVALDVPGVTQLHTYSCGSTASWSVLSALGWGISLRRWVRLCHIYGMSAEGGCDEDQLLAALRQIGATLTTRPYRGPEQAIDLINAGSPFLFVRDGSGFGGSDHWMYVYGYEADHILVGNVVSVGRSQRRVTWGRWENQLATDEIHVVEEHA